MPSSRQPQPLSEQVRTAWEALGAGADAPDLAVMIAAASASTGLSDAEIADGCVEDAEQRIERGLPWTLEHYLATIPEHAKRGEVVRALLMLECSTRTSEDAVRVATDLRGRFPDLAGEIDEVASMFTLMRSVTPADTGPLIEAGTLLDEYRLEEWLGAGSFGEVWRAWDRTLERYVALKLIPTRGAEGATLAAVIREAKSAASIDHENVVSVHDAGRFDTASLCYIDTQIAGDPAPTREDPKHVAVAKSLAAVIGDSGKDASARNTLQPRSAAPLASKEAARLMSAVCRGVAAAHARGIVHRDIKPSNILVTPSGRPMVADFGLSALSARDDNDGASGGAARGTTFATLGSGRITGTPAFMAPEQARGEPATPASDVFSLGATLRYVLTAKLPFAPSGRYSKDERWDVIEQVRRFECTPLAEAHREIPADLAAICDRAMAPDAKARYPSAQSMADDLAAFLDGRPVTARPAGALRASLMWAARNRAVVGLTLLMLVLGSAGLWRYVVNIGRERDRAVAAESATAKQLAETERARASTEAVRDFLEGMISSADPGALGNDAKIVDALKLAAGEIEPRFRGQPALEADVRGTMGMLFGALSMPDEAREQLERALRLRLETIGPDAPESLNIQHALIRLDSDAAHNDSTVAALEALVETMRTKIGAEHKVTLSAEHALAGLYAVSHRFDDALKLFTHVAEVRRRTLGDEHPLLLSVERYQAMIRFINGDMDGGLSLFASVIDRYKRTLGENHFDTLNTMTELGFCYTMVGRNEEATALYLHGYAGLSRLLPPGHEELLGNAKPAANILVVQLNRPAEALALFEPIALAYLARPDRSPFHVATTEQILAACYLGVGRVPEAEALLVRSRERLISMTGEERNSVIRNADKFLAEAYEALGLEDLACEYRALSGAGVRGIPRPRGQ